MAVDLVMTNVNSNIDGDNSGQIAVGSYIYQLEGIYGGIVNISSPQQKVKLTARTTPFFLRPRQFIGLLGRKSEVSSIITNLGYEQPVEFYGREGLGKSVLLRYLCHHPRIESLFADGIIYCSARGRSVSDLLQFLFNAFFESDISYKPTNDEIIHKLQNKKALVLLDDVQWEKENLDKVMNAAPDCVFMLTSLERHIWGEGYSLALPGLPQNDALRLVEQELRRPLTEEELSAAKSLCVALGNHPLDILQAVAMVREENRSLAKVAQLAQSSSRKEFLLKQVLGSLNKRQTSILGLLAALIALVSLATEQISSIMNRSGEMALKLEPILDSLQQRHLIQSEGNCYRLANNLINILQEGWNLTSYKEQIFKYCTNYLQQYQAVPENLLQEPYVVLELLKWGLENGYHAEVIALGQAAEGSLTFNGQWDAWKQVLEETLQAAQTTVDQAAESWAWHQMGTRELCLGNKNIAQRYLERALHIRESLDDQIGAEITRHNLNILNTVPEPDKGDQSGDEPGFKPVFPAWLKVIIPIFILLLGGWGIWWFLFSKPEIELSVNNLDFNKLEINKTSPGKTVTIANEGRKSLKIFNVDITGSEKDYFKIIGNDCAEKDIINPQDDCQVSVNFTPTTVGKHNADLKIFHNTSDTPQVVQLNGTGIAPEISVNPDPLSFGRQRVRTRSQSRTITVTNNGSAPLIISNINRRGNNRNDFTASGCANQTLAPGENCTITVRFRPRAAGSRNAQLNIVSNAGSENVNLNGTGIGNPQISVNPDSLSFGEQKVGGSSQSKPITVTNKGSAPLIISNINPTGNNPNDFTASGCANQTLAPDQNCTITVRFTPRARGNRNAQLNIVSNAGSENVNLNGTGIIISIPRVNPRSLSFGRQRVRTRSQPKTITVTNDGGAPLIIRNINPSGNNRNDFTASGCANQTLAPGENCTITVRFTPRASGSRNAQLNIVSNAGSRNVNLNGTGISIIRIRVNPRSLSFGRQRVRTRSQPKTITVTNDGGAPLIIRNINPSGNNRNDFTASGCANQTLAPDENCTITVRFRPRAAGSRNAQLNIVSNAGSRNVNLNGTGIPRIRLDSPIRVIPTEAPSPI